MNIEDLKKQILAANQAYRDGHPTMDDQMFDDLCDKCQSLVPADEWDAFRNRLHEAGGKVKHPFIMGSLDKLKFEEPDEVIAFVKSLGNDINISAKVDGISSRVSYKAGKFISLTTRGDGSFGIDITNKATYINGLPKELVKCGSKKLIDKDFEIRGELVILKDDFIKLNEDTNGKFANARNACAGIMNRKDWSKDEVKFITFVPYTVLGQEYNKCEQFKILSSIEGMKPAWHVDVIKDNLTDIPHQLFDYASQDFSYTTDGLVLCASSYKNEDKYRPEHMCAFKINQQVGETKLVDVVWEGPSKDGFMCPVGIVDPIELGGATISRVTLHNLDIIDELGLMYGSKILLKRSGDVIPHIEKVISNDNTCSKIELPVECTCCGSILVRDGVNLRCMNKDCADQVVHRLTLFIKKLGVKSASNATLKNFGLTSFEKLMSFIPDKKYKSEVKLFDELYAKVFSQSKEKLLGAMNFVGLSETLIGKIVSHYGYDTVSSSSFADEAFKSLPDGIGELTLQKFIDGLSEALAQVNMVINDTRWHFIEGAPASSKVNVVCKGSICVTGSLKFGSRDKFLEFAKAHGYEAKSGVSKGLTYLVNNDINSNSSKNRKAKTLGIQIITEESFMKMLNDSNVEQSLDSI